MSKSEETEFLPLRSALWAAGGVMAGAGFYLFSFIRLALPEIATAAFGEELWRMSGLWFWVGLGGVAGSVFAAWKFNVYRWQRQLSWALRACAVGGVLTLSGTGWPVLMLAALVSGAAFGALAVILTTGLRTTIGTGSLGWVMGWGVGLASTGSALMEMVGATARTQSVGATFLIAAVSVLSPFLAGQEPSSLHRGAYAGWGMVRWLAVLLLLGVAQSMLFDVTRSESAGFPGPDASGGFSIAVALLSLVAAVVTGWGLDRGGRWTVAGGGAALILLGLGLAGKGMHLGADLAYALGASVYFTLLAYYPARSGRAWFACLVFVSAGGLGAAIGMGLASR